MKKISKIALFFSLFLVIFSFTSYAEPIWSNPKNITPTNYSPSTYSEFNVTWMNDINMTFITITNSSGYVLVNNSTMSNLTYTGDIYNYSIILPVGTFNWTSYANDSSNSWNSTGNITFTIYQADNSVHLYLNGSVDQNKNYTYPEAINATATSSGGTVYLYRNNEHIINGTSPQSELVLLGTGTYNYTVNATGNQNYSDNTTGLGLIFYAFVKNNISNVLNLFLNGSISSLIVAPSTLVEINTSENADNDDDVNYTLWNDSHLINSSLGNGNFSNIAFPITTGIRGIYNYTYNTTGGANWSNGSKSITLFVTDINYTSISATPPNQSNYLMGELYNFSINISGNVSKVYFVANFNNSFVEYNNTPINVTNWNKNITMYNNSGGFWINFTDLKASNFYYWWAIKDINNTWVNTSNSTYTVNKTPITPSLSSDSGWEVFISSTASVIITCSATNATLNLNGGSCANSGFGSVSCTVYPTDNITYNCSTSATSNYTGSTSRTLVAISTSSETPIYTPPSTGSFTFSPSSSSITLEPNSSGTITFTLRNTYSYNITKINITVSGIDTSWYSLSKVNISVLLKNNGTDTSVLTLNIPEDAERRNYTIIVSAAGRDSGGSRLTRQTSVKLIVPEIQNVTNVTNETESFNTTGIGGQANQTNVTGLSINIEEIKDYIVLIIASVSIILIFIFRNEFTDLISGKKLKVHPERKAREEKVIEEQIHKEEKKIHRIFSHVKKKFSGLSERRLVIQIKKKEKKEEEKKT